MDKHILGCVLGTWQTKTLVRDLIADLLYCDRVLYYWMENTDDHDDAAVNVVDDDETDRGRVYGKDHPTNDRLVRTMLLRPW